MQTRSASDDRPTVLVLGAAGRFGAAACAAFAQAGWRVLAHGRAHHTLHQAAEPLRADLDSPALQAAARHAQAVVHAINVPYPQWRAHALPMLRAGTALAARAGALFVLPGNIYNFDEVGLQPVRAYGPQRPISIKGGIRADMETHLRDQGQAGLRSVVLRAGDFFGGGAGSWLDLGVLSQLKRGRLVYPGPRDVPHAWAFLPDLARATVALAQCHLQQALPTGLTDLPFAGYTLTGDELLDAITAALADIGHAPAKGWQRTGMPWGVIRLGGWVVPMWRELAEMAYLWRVPHALDGSALAELIGPEPHTPLRQALAHAVADLRPVMPALQVKNA